MPSLIPESHVAAVRAFNRFYTCKLGVLDQQILKSPFSLTEARVLYELAHRESSSAKEIGTDLGIDPGYLSRILQGFIEKGLIIRKPSPSDRRQYWLSLTAKGRLAAGKLNLSSQDEIAKMLSTLPAGDSERVIQSMATIQHLFDPADKPVNVVMLRPHRPGDMGWVVQEHGALYAREFGWDISFEGLVAEIVAQFLKKLDPTCERCWIAEIDNQQVGSVFLMKQSDSIAKIRLLLVNPTGRGIGLGKQLVNECIAFARQCGYRKITLWTQSILLAARGIYQDAGFVHIASEPHSSFGQELVGETWELVL
jgi:DNA-binding MarR family transcriptional regulator/GNAT superfamily N-acetyltransferase